MAKIDDKKHDSSNRLFNGPLETGVRAVVVLNAVFPLQLDLSDLTLLDHLVVHTADVDGPVSLHPNLPQRTGEMLVRRRLIEQGIKLMRRFQMISVQPLQTGIFYQATEDASAFAELLRSEYAVQLKIRAKWLAENVCILGREAMSDLAKEKLGRWNVEFQTSELSSGILR
jgi:hypothetical protein